MKKFILISCLPLAQQILENSKSELTMEYIQYMVLFFFLAMAMTIMMLIPVVLFFSMVGNLISSIGYKKKIDRGTNFKEFNAESEYLKSLCKKYIRSYSNFCKYFGGLAAWNIFSLLYVSLSFESFLTGLKEYFYFPFYVFQTLSNEKIYNSIYVFKTEGMFMLTIAVLTFSFYQIGKYIGLHLAKKNINERNLNLVIS
jgi:hypothetical protein